MDNRQPSQSGRFLIAAALSLAVLFGWSYFFAPKPQPKPENAEVAQNTAPQTPTPVVQQTPAPTPLPATDAPQNPDRTLTIRTPLYEVEFDAKGALAKSWILLKDVSPRGEKPLYADGSNETNQKKLQIISPEALSRNPREIPFRLSTGDQSIDSVVNERNFEISASEQIIELTSGQEKQIVFSLKDGSGLEVTKTFTFRADSYVSDLQTRVTKGGQIVPNVKLLIGASIGDQAIPHHNFYHIESEAVAHTSGSLFRQQGASFTFDAQNLGATPVQGNVDWAGVGDAYFAMAAIPATPASGLEFRASKYEVNVEPFYDGIFGWILRRETTRETRHLITAYVPVNSDGSSVTKIYTGTKDYFALANHNEQLSTAVGRTLNFEDLINWSNWSWFRAIFKFLSIPILYSLDFLNNFTSNYGISIIIFTFIFYSLLFPLRWSQSKSFKKASGNAPKMKELQDKLKDMQKKGVPNDDPRMRELQMQQLKMTKDALPIGGCLPMLLQFPLLIAFYTAVTVSLAIRQASFIWLPDLSAGDPYHILEFAFVISMVLAMKFTPTSAAITPEQQMQQKMMTYLMPLMMLWIMWSAPAGLLLYWFFGNIVSFGQQMIINRINKSDEPPKEEIVDNLPKNVKKVKPKLSTS